MFYVSSTFAWMVWRAQRWGILCTMACLLGAALVSAVLPAYCDEQWAKGFVGGAVAGLYILMTYVLVVFCWSDASDIMARHSCYPSFLFRLPVPTAPLALWPMAVGAALVAILWLITASFILRPWLAVLGTDVPLWWPAVFGAAALGWLQALLWLPFAVRWLRGVTMSAMFLFLYFLAAASAQSPIPEGWLVSFFAVLAVAAWTVGYLGVKRGRCGDAPNWEAMLGPLRRLARRWPRQRALFPSAAQAQFWFEWRLSGWTLAFVTGLCLPFVLIPLLFTKYDVIPIERTLLSALAVPVFVAGVLGQRGAGNNPGSKGQIGLGPFSATLPMATADMVAAMLKVTVRSTLAAWILVAVMVPLAVLLTGNLENVADLRQQALGEFHPLRDAAIVVGAAILLVVWTWKRQVDKLYFGLSGRPWVAVCAMVSFGASIFVLLVLAVWIHGRPERLDTILAVLPWVLGPLILCRLALAAWALRQSLRRGLLSPGTVARWLALWLLLVSVPVVLLAVALPPTRVPRFDIALGVLWAMPMARLAAAPLTLAWNRNR